MMRDAVTECNVGSDGMYVMVDAKKCDGNNYIEDLSKCANVIILDENAGCKEKKVLQGHKHKRNVKVQIVCRVGGVVKIADL